MKRYRGPLLTSTEGAGLRTALARGKSTWTGSLDLGRSTSDVRLDEDTWHAHGVAYPYPGAVKERSIHYWNGQAFTVAAVFGSALFKLVPTSWGAPTFEIDGIKMLPTERESPLDDARRKVALVEARGKTVLDTCAGLGYFAIRCLEAGAAHVHSWEKNAEVLWLRSLNPWSPDPEAADVATRLTLATGDITQAIASIPDASVDAILHDPPRFGIAGELYAQSFYDQLARVLRRGGRMFHYTGTPNRLTSGRDVPREVARRLDKAGFRTELALDGVFARRVG